MRSAFEYACERMSTGAPAGVVLPIIYDMVDYSNAIFDPTYRADRPDGELPRAYRGDALQRAGLLEKFGARRSRRRTTSSCSTTPTRAARTRPT